MNPLFFLAQAPSPTPDIHDIAAPVYVFPYPMWVVYTAAGITLAVIALFAWLIVHWWRNRPAPVPPTPREVAITALEKARKQIHAIDPYAFSILVSDILRRYISAEYALRATQQTSPEFLESIADYPSFTAKVRQLLAAFLEKCDLIKFAHIGASGDDSSRLLDQAFLFVQGGAA